MTPLTYLIVLFGVSVVVRTASSKVNFLATDRNIKAARKISRCIQKSAEALFTPSNDIFIIAPGLTRHSDLLQVILEETFANRTVEISTKFPNDSRMKPGLVVKPSSFVLIDATANLRRLLAGSSVNRWSEYIIVTVATTRWLDEFSDDLWNLGYVKVAFVRVTPHGSGALHRPIQNPSFRGSSPRLRAFDLCDDENPTSTLSSQVHRAKITVRPFSSMLQTPTNATLKFAKIMEGTQSGDEWRTVKANGKSTSFGIDVMQLFAAKYNVEMRECDCDQDEMTWSDARDYCEAGEFDFFYARQLPPETNCCQLVDPIAWYTYETLVFVDNVNNIPNPLTGLLLPYRGYVWFFTIALLVTFAVFACAIENLWRQGLIRERITVLHVWSIFVGQSVPILPTKFSLRYVLGLWILYNLNNNLLYAGTFSSALTTANHRVLATFQDILDSGRPICGSNKTKQILNDPESPVIHSLHEKMEPVVSADVIGKVLEENYIGSRHLMYVSRHNFKYRTNHSLQLYVPAEAAIVTYPSFYFSKKSHPYNKDFGRLVSNARDSGILAYLQQAYFTVLGSTKDKSSLTTTDGPFLGMKHLRVIFNVLFIGHFISTLVFLIEICMHRKSTVGPRK